MVYCFLAQGFEELEAIGAIDMLKRAGIDVVMAGVGAKEITGSHGITVVTDICATEIDSYCDLEAVVLPGGMPGTLNLQKSPEVQKAIEFASENGKIIAAICAAPLILGHKGLLEGRQATVFPGFEKDLTGAALSKEHIVRDGNIITAKGAGVAADFGLEIVAALKDNAIALEIRASIQSRC